ncbi:glycoside hydrolase family 78 protein [Lentzea californiensis]|uniref:glycoside hydrolase family 78 protein n=1 Tax=Lentzea californiensis TaxID=438851 RepID=UPI002165AA00|nr:glycoside hydrolase family 78 protein [Lentzea californiensis]MCR3751879.1 alpha-L-rhamnosidase [Lentzea californiensis]
MRRRVFLRTSAVGLTATALPVGVANAAPPERAGGVRVVRTTVEYAETLLGTDVTAPRLGWVLAADGTGARQTAYQVEVGTALGRADVWQSGKVGSDRTTGVAYAGKELKPRTRYHWRVRVWDGANRPSAWSTANWWETALLGTPWQARWIGAEDTSIGFAGARWIWSATTPAESRWFRTSVDLPADAVRARLVATADDDFTLYVNGSEVVHVPEQVDVWKIGQRADVTRLAGRRIVLAARATNRSAGPAGFLLRLLVDLPDGQREVVTGPGWRVAETEQTGWQAPDFDDSAWTPATVLDPYGQGPWGANVTVKEQPAPLLRREFALTKPVRRARLYVSGLAYHETEINGRRVGDRVLDPGFTDYDNTVLYATHDVTSLVRNGRNAIGVTLGRGFYGMKTPNVWRWERPPWHDEPKLLAQLEIDHPDGTRTTITSDEQWRLTDGPTVSNSLYTGETYDARLAPRDWTKPGFDDGAWQHTSVRPAPKGTLQAQEHEPIRVIESVTPTVSVLRPGVFVADMGRTMSGWTQLTVTAPAGTTVRLKHGETLNSDGSVRMENGHVSGGRIQLDEYVCAGGTETWEPKFSYKGFRYVEVTGLTAAPKLVGRLVHSDVPQVSTFRCSEPLFEQYDAAMRRTVANNLHGIPTDTPTYEKNGWTGDAQVGAPSMLAEFGMAKFFTKWLGDLADSQDAAGQLPVIVPSGGWGYRELAPAPEWTTVYPFVLREMYRIYGDDRLPAQHWPVLTRYLDWEIGRLRDGLAVTALGDFLPPGSGGIPPEDTRLTATAYLYRALLHTAELGDVIGKPVPRYREVAAGLLSAFNNAFLDGYYRTAKDTDYRQTSNAIPLAFGMVPAGSVQTVADKLASEVRANGNHVNVGCLGASVLLQALGDNGHADVAHAMATERSYPSWGHWFSNGADTMWEMWDTGTRSRNHYFKGTIVQWLYEHVAGLRPGDAGYRTFTVRPSATALSWARFEFESVRGRISVAWAKVDDVLRLTVEVPVGSTAEVHVPHISGVAVVKVPHGRWAFTGGGTAAAAATAVPAS